MVKARKSCGKRCKPSKGRTSKIPYIDLTVTKRRK